MKKASVIICTHNPRAEFLRRTLDALKDQSLCSDLWELLLIDNGSTIPLKDTEDISWHPNGRHIREDNLGLTPARLRGIAESSGEILAFVDDDNILKPDFLELALKQMKEIPILGALGAGRILPEYETEPTEELKPFMIMLALRDDPRPEYSNVIGWHKAVPYGAGLCIRRFIAEAYAESCKTRTHTLDRKGNALLSGGDVDMALHACKIGYLVGVIPGLELIHLIPKSRLEPGYLIRIAAGHATSNYILSRLWGYYNELPENAVLKAARYWKKRLQVRGLAKEIFIAEQRAGKEAHLNWENHQVLTTQ